jgi:hypothetical protein
LKQKKGTVLDITGFFFRMSTQVKAEVGFLFPHEYSSEGRDEYSGEGRGALEQLSVF